MQIRHRRVATFPDQPDVEINATEWNEDHISLPVGVASITRNGSGFITRVDYINGDSKVVTRDSNDLVQTLEVMQGTLHYIDTITRDVSGFISSINTEVL